MKKISILIMLCLIGIIGQGNLFAQCNITDWELVNHNLTKVSMTKNAFSTNENVSFTLNTSYNFVANSQSSTYIRCNSNCSGSAGTPTTGSTPTIRYQIAKVSSLTYNDWRGFFGTVTDCQNNTWSSNMVYNQTGSTNQAFDLGQLASGNYLIIARLGSSTAHSRYVPITAFSVSAPAPSTTPAGCQTGVGCMEIIDLDKIPTSLPSEGGKFYFSIRNKNLSYTSMEWYIDPRVNNGVDRNIFNVSPQNGGFLDGGQSANVELTLAPNNTTSQRNISITFENLELAPGDPNRYQTFNFTQAALPQYTINTSANTSNGGSTLGGGTFAQGTVITVRAIPNNGYIFKYWLEGSYITSYNADYESTVTNNRNLIAVFEQQIQNYTITTSASPSSGGTTSGAGTFVHGSTTTITAIANSGYTFKNWTENGNEVSTNASYSFTLNSDRILVANFETVLLPKAVKVVINPSNGGKACINNDCKGNGEFFYLNSGIYTVSFTVVQGYEPLPNRNITVVADGSVTELIADYIVNGGGSGSTEPTSFAFVGEQKEVAPSTSITGTANVVVKNIGSITNFAYQTNITTNNTKLTINGLSSSLSGFMHNGTIANFSNQSLTINEGTTIISVNYTITNAVVGETYEIDLSDLLVFDAGTFDEIVTEKVPIRITVKQPKFTVKTNIVSPKNLSFNGLVKITEAGNTVFNTVTNNGTVDALLEANKTYEVSISRESNDIIGTNIADVARSQAYLLGKTTLTWQQKVAAEISGDGSLNILDVSILQARLLGKTVPATAQFGYVFIPNLDFSTATLNSIPQKISVLLNQNTETNCIAIKKSDVDASGFPSSPNGREEYIEGIDFGLQIDEQGFTKLIAKRDFILSGIDLQGVSDFYSEKLAFVKTNIENEHLVFAPQNAIKCFEGETILRFKGNPERLVGFLSDENFTLKKVRFENLTSENKGIIVYPNPSTGIFKLAGLPQSSKISVTDLLGKQVLETTNLRDELNLTHLGAGIYFLKIDSEKIVQKIIINK